MKKVLILIILFLIDSLNYQAQTYRQMFDNKDQTAIFQTGGYSFYTNFKSDLHREESIIMIAYINMYKATSDIKYLNEFIIHAKRVMDRRDDHLTANSVVAGFPISYQTQSGNWLNNCSASGVLPSISSVLTSSGFHHYPAWSRIEYDNNCNLN